MSLESIIQHIEREALAKRDSIIGEAGRERERVLEDARREAGRLYDERMEKERVVIAGHKQRITVNARLDGRKNVLAAKQDIVGSCFEKAGSSLPKNAFMKERITGEGSVEAPEETAFYMEQARSDHETAVAEILFK